MEGFLLHKRRFKESSLLVELLTLENGRVTAIVKGALRAKSRLGMALEHLIRLRMETVGKSRLPILTRAEAIENFPRLSGIDSFSLLYANELIIKSFAQDDPIPDIYREYIKLLNALTKKKSSESALRYFELTLLKTMGVKPLLDHTTDTNLPISPTETYYFDPYNGISEDRWPSPSCLEVKGQTLTLLERESELIDQPAKEAKLLMRMLIQHHLEGRTLNARKLLPRKP